jgi:methyl coenzyme M reductase subunit C-like uncharacterized protein (methanogenesis marker protein 7)
MRKDGRKVIDRTPAACGNEDMGHLCATTTCDVPAASIKRRKDGTNINSVGHRRFVGRGADTLKEVENCLINHD